MNSRLDRLQPYPFERLRALLDGVAPPDLPPIRLSIGEPQHATPEVLTKALAANLSGLAAYPTTAGLDTFRETLAGWFSARYRLPTLDPRTQVLPVNGSREALFSFAQSVIDASARGALVASPNPFYQIYEGAALLAGADLVCLNQVEADDYALNPAQLSSDEWQRVQLLYVCSPGNPTGRVLRLDEWAELFELADRHDFVIASDECYSEIYPDEAAPPLGGLEAANALGRSTFARLLVFTSLSKRSNAPGLRSGAVAGDAELLRRFLLYRTYHGCAMSLAVQHASIAAWRDETHVRANREQYRQKFAEVRAVLAATLSAPLPDAGFYLWVKTPGADDAFARALFAATHVTVLPGRYLGRDAHGLNPGHGYMRMALVPELAHCVDGANRIASFCRSYIPQSR